MLRASIAVIAASLAVRGALREPAPRDTPLPRYVRLAYAARDLHWRRASRPHVEVYAERESFTARDVERLATDAERARRDDLAFLGLDDDSTMLHVVFVGSRAQMARVVGSPVGGSGDASDGGVIAVATPAIRPALRHEMMHVLSAQRWGPPAARWITEGLAMYAAGACHGYDIDAMTAALAADEGIVSLAELRASFDPAGRRGIAMYASAASLTRFVDRTYGRAELRALWTTGLAGVQQSLGVSADVLEAAWQAHVARTAHATRWSRIVADVTAHGCE